MSDTIRKRASELLDIYIAEGQWDYIVDQLDKEGKFTRKSLLNLVLLLCKKVEELEIIVKDLSVPKPTAQAPTPSVNPISEQPKEEAKNETSNGA